MTNYQKQNDQINVNIVKTNEKNCSSVEIQTFKSLVNDRRRENVFFSLKFIDKKKTKEEEENKCVDKTIITDLTSAFLHRVDQT